MLNPFMSNIAIYDQFALVYLHAKFVNIPKYFRNSIDVYSLYLYQCLAALLTNITLSLGQTVHKSSSVFLVASRHTVLFIGTFCTFNSVQFFLWLHDTLCSL